MTLGYAGVRNIYKGNKADKGIYRMEREQKLLAKLMKVDEVVVQRQRKGGLK